MELKRDRLVSPIQEVRVIEGEVVALIRELAGRAGNRLAAHATTRWAWRAIRCGGICGSRSPGGATTDGRRATRGAWLYEGPAGGNAVVPGLA
jgi:hypothetical protein